MRSIEELTEEILSLPSASRALLVDKLLDSLELGTDSTPRTVWLAEAKRRRDIVYNDSGHSVPEAELLSADDFGNLTEQLTEEFAACFDADPPILSDDAVSRAGIYLNHP